MNKSLEVGYVSEVSGNRIRIKTYEKTNNPVYFVDGKTYQGCLVGNFIGILNNQYKIIARIEKEYLNDLYMDHTSASTDVYYSLDRFEREIEVTIVGFFLNQKFSLGIKQYPQIYNKAVLLDNEEIITILTGNHTSNDQILNIGKTVNEDLEYPIEWGNLFNTHIGIFGNTGSGKSNTLAKLYSTLFSNESINLKSKSKFVVVDFNGEYTGDDVLASSKKIYDLSTRTQLDNISDRIPIDSQYFLNVETLSVLFSATEQTQKPFLERMLNYYGENIISTSSSTVINDLKNGFINVYMGNYKKESKNIFDNVVNIIKNGDTTAIHFEQIEWHGTMKDFIKPGTPNYIIGDDLEYVLAQADTFREDISVFEDNIEKLTLIQRLHIYCCLQLLYGLRYGALQFDFISPLINRIAARSKDFEKIFKISNENFYDDNFLYVISLKNCNQEIKKIVPLFLVKQIYEIQKHSVGDSIENTTHLIIDEAHNILSEKSNREAEMWKDYRLETFEEIVKEGRKFGFYLTVCSQRPSDISPTIVSQLHNYFLHRLVNDRDLYMIDNTISSLDKVSKSSIPILAPGQAILTGTAFHISQVIKVKELEENRRPRSESANLEDLWLENHL